MAKPLHQKNKAFSDTVALHAMVGTPQKIIASILKIDQKTLRKYYREELEESSAKATATIGGALFNKAKNGDTAAQIFWMKTRARWTERHEYDHTSSDGSLGPTRIEIVAPDQNNSAD